MPPLQDDLRNRIGRRIKLRDLQVLAAVAQFGSMARAAAHLSTTQPTVSQAIADLEDTIGVRLFDRSTHGVSPTAYGDILLRRTGEAFDALGQALREIEFLSGSGRGDVWIGCAEATLHGFVPVVIERLAATHPGIVVHAFDANTADNVFQRLRGHEFDLMIGRSSHAAVDDDLQVETLFDEPFLVVCGSQSPWARRRRVDLADLIDAQWIFGEPGNATQARISEAFRARAGRLPPVRVFTTSMNLRLALLETGNYLSCIPGSTYRFGAQGRPLKALPIDMGLKLPVAIFTLKNRTPTPAVRLFVECAREVARTMGAA